MKTIMWQSKRLFNGKSIFGRWSVLHVVNDDGNILCGVKVPEGSKVMKDPKGVSARCPVCSRGEMGGMSTEDAVADYKVSEIMRVIDSEFSMAKSRILAFVKAQFPSATSELTDADRAESDTGDQPDGTKADTRDIAPEEPVPSTLRDMADESDQEDLTRVVQEPVQEEPKFVDEEEDEAEEDDDEDSCSACGDEFTFASRCMNGKCDDCCSNSCDCNKEERDARKEAAKVLVVDFVCENCHDTGIDSLGFNKDYCGSCCDEHCGCRKSDKPECILTGTDGNVFSVIAKVISTLRRAKQPEKAEEFSDKARASKSYDEVMALCFNYVDVN